MEQRLLVTAYQNAAVLEEHAAQEIAGVITTAINARGVCFVALSGGETPRQIYRHLGMEPLKDQVNWSKVQLFFSDERAVPPNDPQSNFGMVEQSLLSWVDIPRAHVHRIKGESDPSLAADEYETELRSSFGDKQLRFDLVLLGVGEDGHVASIFPGTEVIDEQIALVRTSTHLHQTIQRITMTFPIINSAREIIFLASGRRKASIVQRVLGTAKPTRKVPATMVRPVEGNLRWMIDRDAASEIDPSIRVVML